MKNCVFCEIDETKKYNTIIEETNNFIIMPSLGSLVDGYLLIIYKKHLYSINKIPPEAKKEYIAIIDRYRKLFKEKYGKYPIVFEHGSPAPNGICSCCLIHAHSHIVNHNYINEKMILEKEKFQQIKDFSDIKTNTNYIYYKNQNGIDYVSYDYEPISQLMRIFIAKDLNISDRYNWRTNSFEDNIEKTIEKFKCKS